MKTSNRTGVAALRVLCDVHRRIQADSSNVSVVDDLIRFSRLHLSAYLYLVEDLYRTEGKGTLVT